VLPALRHDLWLYDLRLCCGAEPQRWTHSLWTIDSGRLLGVDHCPGHADAATANAKSTEGMGLFATLELLVVAGGCCCC